LALGLRFRPFGAGGGRLPDALGFGVNRTRTAHGFGRDRTHAMWAGAYKAMGFFGGRLVIFGLYDAGDAGDADKPLTATVPDAFSRRMNGKRREGIVGGLIGVLLTTLVGICLVLVLGVHTGSGQIRQPNPGKTRGSALPGRNGASPKIQCADPVTEDHVIGGSVTTTGSADCATAGLVLARCGDGACEEKAFTLEGDRFFCISHRKGDKPPESLLRAWGCVGSGQSVEWTDTTG
jgi:hypothetical protein